MAQQLFYNKEVVDSIVIKSSVGAYQFDDEHTYTSSSDIYSFKYDKRNGEYIVVSYKKMHRQKRSRPNISSDSIEIRKHTVRRYTGRIIDRKYLDSLFQALQTSNEVNIKTLRFEKPLDKIVTPSAIKNVASLYGEGYQFKRRYLYKDEKKEIYEGCRNMDTLNLYFDQLEFNTTRSFIRDAHAYINITLYADSMEYEFMTSSGNHFGLPWFVVDDKNLYSNQKHVINPYINYYLLQVLPRGYLLKEMLLPENILGGYIKWYLCRRDVIYSCH